VAGMAGAACAEWHLHAWDLARALGADYRPADPAVVLAGWRSGMPHLPLPAPGRLAGLAGRGTDPWHAVLAASGRLAASSRVAGARRGAGRRPRVMKLARLGRPGKG
jgi:hypothetical protein